MWAILEAVGVVSVPRLAKATAIIHEWGFSRLSARLVNITGGRLVNLDPNTFFLNMLGEGISFIPCAYLH